MKIRSLLTVAGMGLVLVSGGCADAPAEEGGVAAAAPTGTAAPAATADVPADGEVIEVKMLTDEKGNYFEPAEITAKQGDVLRFVLVSGVHNVSFPAADNPGKTGLPEVGPYLQIAGQTYDVPVTMQQGEYTFVCDPHAALGMVGTVKVE